ncbi:MAG: glycosyltransferase family 4 protein [Planctomycetes bacterium]|nr:glycosyltransferase family 4 protein [Planctomycetota bacterium]
MTDTRVRILLVNHQSECGGAEHSLLELIEGLDPKRFALHLACTGDGPLAARARELGAEVHPVPMRFQGPLRKLFGLPRAVFALRRVIRGNAIDLVHANTLIAGYCATVAAKLCGVPVVWHVRDIGYPAVARRICRLADRIIANSRATAESLQVPEDHLHVVHNGVGPRFFAPPAAGSLSRLRSELGIPADHRLVGMFGRLDRWKGHLDLLGAAATVLRSRPDTTFVIVGGSPFADGVVSDYRAELESAARELGIADSVCFTGPREDVPLLLAAMDVVVHPSAQPEPFGRVIAEAQAAGKPVVGSAAGGIPELIDDGVTGLLFPPGDVEALADRIATLLDDPELARRLGAAAHRNARERFTQAVHAASVAAVYDEVRRHRNGEIPSN